MTEQTASPGLVQRVMSGIDRYQRHHPWAGFPLAVVKKFGEDQARHLAALVAYYGFFALFPLLLALVTLLAFTLADHPEWQDAIVRSALANFPVFGGDLRSNVGSLPRSGTALVIGLVGLVWAGLAAMGALQNAMNTVWGVPLRDRPRFLQARLRGVAMLAMLGGGLLITTVLAGVVAGLSGLGPIARLVGIALSLGANTGLFLLAFKLLADIEIDWRALLPGAVVAGTAWVALQAVGGLYVSHLLRSASRTYGAFAVVIGLLSWLYLQAQITLVAAELNVVRVRRLWPRQLGANLPLTAADRRALRISAMKEERVPGELVQVELPESQPT
jgi:YihY family inner membrane protein